MGNVGSFFGVPFSVSSRMVQTIDNLIVSGSARIAMHNRVGKKSLTEHLGTDPKIVNFDMQLLSSLGVNVRKVLETFDFHLNRGSVGRLVIGRKSYGTFQILNMNVREEQFDGNRNVSYAVVSFGLLEYLTN